MVLPYFSAVLVQYAVQITLPVIGISSGSQLDETLIYLGQISFLILLLIYVSDIYYTVCFLSHHI